MCRTTAGQSGHEASAVLPAGFTLRPATASDAEALLTFNIALHGPLAGTVWQYLHTGAHPACDLSNSLVMTDADGQIVSTLSLIPVQWRMGQTTLRLGQIEFVGTLPAYRGRGLIRALMARVHQQLHEDGLAFSTINGLPYYYRQFGYEYAVDVSAVGTLVASSSPAPPVLPQITVRPIRETDVTTLVRLDEERYNALDLASVTLPSAITWFAHAWHWEENRASGWIAERAGQALGACWAVADGAVLTLSGATGTREAAQALLAHALTQPGITQVLVAEPPDAVMGQLVQDLGVQPLPPEAWYIHVSDPVRAFEQVAPELERRVAASRYAGLSRTLTISLYRLTIRLTFRDGRITAITPLPRTEPGDLAVPPDVLPKLLFGYRDVASLSAMYPDLMLGQEQVLAQILFPPLRSYVRFLV